MRGDQALVRRAVEAWDTGLLSGGYRAAPDAQAHHLHTQVPVLYAERIHNENVLVLQALDEAGVVRTAAFVEAPHVRVDRPIIRTTEVEVVPTETTQISIGISRVHEDLRPDVSVVVVGRPGATRAELRPVGSEAAPVAIPLEDGTGFADVPAVRHTLVVYQGVAVLFAGKTSVSTLGQIHH